jgi:hypothetical protein
LVWIANCDPKEILKEIKVILPFQSFYVLFYGAGLKGSVMSFCQFSLFVLYREIILFMSQIKSTRISKRKNAKENIYQMQDRFQISCRELSYAACRLFYVTR